MTRRLLLRMYGALLATAMASAGCADDPSTVAIAAWTVEVPGRTEAPVPITLPVHLDSWMEPSPDGVRPPSFLLRTRFEVPTELRGKPLTLAIPCCFSTLATLRIDGEEAIALDASVLNAYRTDGTHSWRIPASASSKPVVELEVEAQNTALPSARVDGVPRVSATVAGDARFLAVKTFNEATALAGLAIALVMTVLYGVIFLSDRRRVAHGWYALGVLAGAAYPAYVLGLLQGAFGTWETYVVPVSVLVAAVMPVYFAHAYFGLARPHWAWSLPVVSAVPVVILLGGPFKTHTWITPIITVSFLAMAVQQVRVFAQLRRRQPRPPNHAVLTLVWPIAMLFGGSDLMASMGAGEALGGLRPMCLSICVIALVQALAIGTEHTLSLKRADQLNEERAQRIRDLQERNREVGLLNDELRHQITARSRSLMDVLSRVASQAKPVSLQPGDVVGDRYRIVRTIGRGGMGEVYEAKRGSDGRRLALKVLAGMVDPLLRARFAREANLIAQVNHPNVVTIVDVDISPEGYLYLVMELVDGMSLHECRSRFGEVGWALEVLVGVARGLEGIHASGVLHRDLKPGNILVTVPAPGSAMQVKITDFGISSTTENTGGATRGSSEFPTVAQRMAILPVDPPPALDVSPGALPDTARMLVQSADASLTLTGMVLGTPAYMAPELARGMTHASPASDVFSFGVLCLEVLTGKRPRAAGVDEGALIAEATALLAPARLDAACVDIILRCLRHSTTERPTAADLHATLHASAQRGGADPLTNVG